MRADVAVELDEVDDIDGLDDDVVGNGALRRGGGGAFRTFGIEDGLFIVVAPDCCLAVVFR